MAVEERVSRLYLRHQAMLMEYVRSLVHDPHDAEDLLQEAGLVILSRAKVPEDDAVFSAWSRGVARNTVMHFWRARQRAKVIPDSRLLDAIDQAFDEADTESELMVARRIALQQCIRLVQGQALTILNLRYLNGLSCRKIADAVRKSPGAVRVALTRTRDSLARCIESRLPEELA